MRTTGIRVLLAAWLLWSAAGAWPVAVVEGDGAAIALVADQWAEQGAAALKDAYRYEMQPGTYVLLMLLARVLHADALVAFSLLSAAAAAALILLSARWISKRADLPFAMCGLVVMLFQETWTSAYYPNSTILAAALVVLAFNLLGGARDRRKLVLGGLVFGLACWMRLDAVVVAPAVPLVLGPTGSGRVARPAALAAAVAAVTLLTAMFASGVEISAVRGSYVRHHDAAGSWNLVLKSFLAFFSMVVLLLAGLGSWRIVANRQWREAAVVVLGAAPLVLVLRSSLTTPKYLLYVVPLVGLLAAQGVAAWQESGGTRRRILAASAAVLFALQYPLGFQVDYAQGFHPGPHPTLLRLASVPVGRAGVEKVTLVLGAGATVSTHDALRLSSGILFSNGTWRYYKWESAAAVEAIRGYLRDSPAGTIGVWIEEPREALQLTEFALVRAGFRQAGVPADGSPPFWKKDGRMARVFCGENGLRQADQLGAACPLLAVVLWNDRAPPILRERFPEAERLTGAGASFNTYVLRPAADRAPIR
ncbi:MAG: hypothetical protein HUU20_07565 [Pirellulales bacterium]|nr:hypothetical protein [Pirellulales bacterium]